MFDAFATVAAGCGATRRLLQPLTGGCGRLVGRRCEHNAIRRGARQTVQ